MGNLDHFYCAMMAVEKREMSVTDQEVHRQGCRVLVCASRKVVGEVELLNATPYDVSNVELGHHGEDVSFNSILASVCSHQTACQASSDRAVAVWRKNSE